jgi:hypothetical protein
VARPVDPLDRTANGLLGEDWRLSLAGRSWSEDDLTFRSVLRVFFSFWANLGGLMC